jgi:hypothetical protein
MTAVSVDNGFAMSEPFERGETTLEEYVGALVATAHDSGSPEYKSKSSNQ